MWGGGGENTSHKRVQCWCTCTVHCTTRVTLQEALRDDGTATKGKAEVTVTSSHTMLNPKAEGEVYPV